MLRLPGENSAHAAVLFDIFPADLLVPAAGGSDYSGLGMELVHLLGRFHLAVLTQVPRIAVKHRQQ